MSELVTEEMVEAAKVAQTQVPLGPGCDDRLLRAALSAVAPLIAARERKRAAKMVEGMGPQGSRRAIAAAIRGRSA